PRLIRFARDCGGLPTGQRLRARRPAAAPTTRTERTLLEMRRPRSLPSPSTRDRRSAAIGQRPPHGPSADTELPDFRYGLGDLTLRAEVVSVTSHSRQNCECVGATESD